MKVHTQSSVSKKYVRASVSRKANNVEVDPTGAVVQMAFTATDVEPISTDWKAASWETGGPPYVARCLVGPAGTVTLVNGYYDWWVRVQAAPEDVQELVGVVVIT